MATTAEALAQAFQLHQVGNFPEAERIYRLILDMAPGNAKVWHLLGVLSNQRAEYPEALTYLRQAVVLDPREAAFHNDLAWAHQAVGQGDEAIACYHRALALRPDFPEAHHNLAIAFQTQGRLEDAVVHYRQAVRLRPNYPQAQYNLGTALEEQGQREEAVGCYRQAVNLRPNYVEAHHKLGLALRELGKLDEAIACYRRALELRPSYLEVHHNLGVAYLDEGRLEEAAASLRQALLLKPDFAEAHYNLGLVLQKQWKDSAACYQQAVRFQPDFPLAHNNLAIALQEQARLEEAVLSYQQAIRLKPDFPDAHKNLGMTWLLLGNFEQGWPEYEWRSRCKEGALPAFPQPFWDGSPLQGRTILLLAEQGLGDTLQFIRYAPLVKKGGGTVLVRCRPESERLLRTCSGIDALILESQPLPAFDVQAPLLSLPGLCGTTLATIPATVPDLTAEPDRVAHWRRVLAAKKGFTVGICWQGNPEHKKDRERSVPLEQFGPLAGLESVNLVSLQKGAGTEQLACLGEQFPVLDLPGRPDDPAEGWVDTAALVRALDLVVTVDTAVAHCAGALGIPVWVALPFVPDWRWLLEREDSPWYPTMRLFRQKRPGDWAEVLARIAQEIRILSGQSF